MRRRKPLTASSTPAATQRSIIWPPRQHLTLRLTYRVRLSRLSAAFPSHFGVTRCANRGGSRRFHAGACIAFAFRVSRRALDSVRGEALRDQHTARADTLTAHLGGARGPERPDGWRPVVLSANYRHKSQRAVSQSTLCRGAMPCHETAAGHHEEGCACTASAGPERGPRSGGRARGARARRICGHRASAPDVPTGRIARPAGSRRFKFQQLQGHPPTFRTKAFESAFSGCRPRGLRLGNLAGSVMALLFSSRFLWTTEVYPPIGTIP